MSLDRITGQRVVDELKAGHMVYMLQLTDITSLTIADWPVATGLSKFRKKTENSVAPENDI